MLETDDIHRLVEAIVDRLAHQRVIGNLARADEVFAAGDLIGKDRGQQILGIHARQRRRHLLAAAEARQGERDAGDPAPARREHRRVEKCLDQDVAHRVRVQVVFDVGEIEAVRRRQRQHDVVFGRGGLQFEIELRAEALAESEAPGAVDAAAIRRMDDELHAADRVEEALEDERVEGRQGAQRGAGGGEIV